MLDVQKSAAAINTQVKQIQRMVSSGNTKIKIDAEINPLKTDTLETNIKTAQTRIQGMLKKYSAMASDPNLYTQWKKLFDSSQLVKTKEELTNINSKMRLLEQQAEAVGKRTRSWGAELKNNVLKMANWMLLGAMLAGIIRKFGEVYNNVVNVNKAMVELRKVTNEADSTYDRFLTNAAQRAKDLSAGLADLITATANFARLGYTFDQAQDLAEVAIMYKNVGDGVDSVDTATSTIISTMKAYNIAANDTTQIIDKLNQVGKLIA